MDFHMHWQILIAIETNTTLRANIRGLTSVGPHVSDQRGLEWKPPLALCTHVEFLSCMNSLMYNKGWFPSEVFPTFNTVIRLFPAMRSSIRIWFSGFGKFSSLHSTENKTLQCFSRAIICCLTTAKMWTVSFFWKGFKVIFGVTTLKVNIYRILCMHQPVGRHGTSWKIQCIISWSSQSIDKTHNTTTLLVHKHAIRTFHFEVVTVLQRKMFWWVHFGFLPLG